MEDSDLRKPHNFDSSDVGFSCSQFPESSSSLSLPSDVPDIGNLFSSYVYESPDSDSCDSIGVFISEKGVLGVTDDSNPKRNEEISPEEYLSTDFPLKSQSLREDQDWCSQSLHSEPADVRNWFPSYVYESPPIDSSNEFGDGDTKHYQKEKDKLIADESEGKEKILGESRDTRFTYEETGDIKEDNQCSNKSHAGGGRSDNLSSQSTVKMEDDNLSSESPTPTKSSVNSENKCLSRAEKELKQILHPKGSSKREALSEDGFIPIRKSQYTRSNGTNLVARSPKNGLHIGVSTCSPLADMTNFGNSITREVIGKWQCPQKGKPNVGPPLKQLRLEQWVQKM